jgi:acetyl-CoA synthetase
MRNINLRYAVETYDEKGVLSSFKLKYPDNFNFGYDIVDDIGVNDPDRPAMVWTNPMGEEHVFTFGEIKKYSDKTANYLHSLGIRKGDMVLVVLKRHYQFCLSRPHCKR